MQGIIEKARVSTLFPMGTPHGRIPELRPLVVRISPLVHHERETPSAQATERFSSSIVYDLLIFRLVPVPV